MIKLPKPLFFLILLLNLTTDAFSIIPEGIFYTHLILNDNTSAHVLEVDPQYFDIISAKAKIKKLESVETIAKQNNAIAAINGGFFQSKGIPVGILKIEDQWYGIPHLPRGAIGWSNSHHKVLFDQLLVSFLKENTLLIIPQSNPNYTTTRDWNSVNYIVGGAPILIRSSEVITDFSVEKTIWGFLYKNHARTAIGILPNGHFVFVVVDGVKYLFFPNKGMTIPNLALFLLDLGCKEALNLDGGGSSTMYLLGNIVSTPCGERYDGKGNYVRAVSDAILIIPKPSTTD